MKQCPKCDRFSVEYDPQIGTERCLWRSCLWINKENRDLDDEEYNCDFEDFKEIIQRKRNHCLT